MPLANQGLTCGNGRGSSRSFSCLPFRREASAFRERKALASRRNGQIALAPGDSRSVGCPVTTDWNSAAPVQGRTFMRVALLSHSAPAGDAIGRQLAEKVAFFVE